MGDWLGCWLVGWVGGVWLGGWLVGWLGGLVVWLVGTTHITQFYRELDVLDTICIVKF